MRALVAFRRLNPLVSLEQARVEVREMTDDEKKKLVRDQARHQRALSGIAAYRRLGDKYGGSRRNAERQMMKKARE